MAGLYIDESQRRGKYVMCGVVVPTSHSQEMRIAARQLRSRGSRRLHMHQETRETRHRAISFMASAIALDVTVVVTDTRGPRQEHSPRERTLAGLLMEYRERSLDVIAFERSTTVSRDLSVVEALGRETGTAFPLVTHLDPHQEPLLWLPDIVAWTLGRDDDYRDRARFPNLTVVTV